MDRWYSCRVLAPVISVYIPIVWVLSLTMTSIVKEHGETSERSSMHLLLLQRFSSVFLLYSHSHLSCATDPFLVSSCSTGLLHLWLDTNRPVQYLYSSRLSYIHLVSTDTTPSEQCAVSNVNDYYADTCQIRWAYILAIILRSSTFWYWPFWHYFWERSNPKQKPTREWSLRNIRHRNTVNLMKPSMIAHFSEPIMQRRWFENHSHIQKLILLFFSCLNMIKIVFQRRDTLQIKIAGNKSLLSKRNPTYTEPYQQRPLSINWTEKLNLCFRHHKFGLKENRNRSAKRFFFI